MNAGSALSEGQSLIVPAGVTRSQYNASTFKPHDAAEAMASSKRIGLHDKR